MRTARVRRCGAPARTSAPARACPRCVNAVRPWGAPWQSRPDRQTSPSSRGRSDGRQLQNAQVGPTGGEDGVDVVGSRDVSGGNRWNARLITDAVAGGHAEQTTVVGATLPDRLTHHDMDQVAAMRPQQRRDSHRLIEVHATVSPIAGGNANEQGTLPARPYRIDDLERESHAILQCAAVLVGPAIR